MLFRTLSIKFHYKLVVGEVSTISDPDFSSKFNLTPGKVGLIYFPTGNVDKFVKYDGKVTREDIFKFIEDKMTLDDDVKVEL